MEKDEDKKDLITKDIIGVSKKVAKIRKELKICEEIQEQIPKMKGQVRKIVIIEKEQITKNKKLENMK